MGHRDQPPEGEGAEHRLETQTTSTTHVRITMIIAIVSSFTETSISFSHINAHRDPRWLAGIPALRGLDFGPAIY